MTKLSRRAAVRAIAVGAFLCAGALATWAQTGPAAKPVTAQAQQGSADHAPGETTLSQGILCKQEDSGGSGCRQSIEADLRTRKPQGPVPRTAWDGKPDFNGVYYSNVTIAPAPVPLESLYKPETRTRREKLQREVYEPVRHCAPSTPARGSTTGSHPIQLLQAPGLFVVMDEQFNVFRIIPTDGRPHNPTHKPSFQGDSVGRWEGDTLVVDVTNFNGLQWLDDVPLPAPTSTALHIVERWTKPDAHTFEYEAVIEDPTLLTAPWRAPKLRRGRLAFDMIQETFCTEEAADTDAAESHETLEEKGLLRK